VHLGQVVTQHPKKTLLSTPPGVHENHLPGKRPTAGSGQSRLAPAGPLIQSDCPLTSRSVGSPRNRRISPAGRNAERKNPATGRKSAEASTPAPGPSRFVNLMPANPSSSRSTPQPAGWQRRRSETTAGSAGSTDGLVWADPFCSEAAAWADSGRFAFARIFPYVAPAGPVPCVNPQRLPAHPLLSARCFYCDSRWVPLRRQSDGATPKPIAAYLPLLALEISSAPFRAAPLHRL